MSRDLYMSQLHVHLSATSEREAMLAKPTYGQSVSAEHERFKLAHLAQATHLRLAITYWVSVAKKIRATEHQSRVQNVFYCAQSNTTLSLSLSLTLCFPDSQHVLLKCRRARVPLWVILLMSLQMSLWVML